jgi:phospholipase/lecithinase/hemolysin
VPLDAYRLLNDIVADPSVFDLTNATAASMDILVSHETQDI